jgi:hypothetical protein
MFSQCRLRPETYREPLRFATIPSGPMRQAHIARFERIWRAKLVSPQRPRRRSKSVALLTPCLPASGAPQGEWR